MAQTSLTPAAPSTAPARALLTSRADWEKMGGGVNYTADPQRLIWVVTVHADMATDGSPGSKPVLKHVYTAAIDAETGQVTDLCIGRGFLE